MSAAFGIKTAIIERLQQYPFFSTFTFRANQSQQVMPDELPYCAVYQLPEMSVADGDPNAGEPSLKSESIIGISVILRNIESDELEEAEKMQQVTVPIELPTDDEDGGSPPDEGSPP